MKKDFRSFQLLLAKHVWISLVFAISIAVLVDVLLAVYIFNGYNPTYISSILTGTAVGFFLNVSLKKKLKQELESKH